MTNYEIRRVAWERLFKGRWFWKLFGGGLLLGICGQAAQTVLGGVLARLGVIGWVEYGQIVAKNQQTLTTPVPELTQPFVVTATSVTALELFVGWIMAGIASYGAAVILSRCLKNDAEGWLGAAFGGFKMPLGLLALMVRYWLICFGWGVLAGFPVGVAFVVAKALVKAETIASACGASAVLSLSFAVMLAVMAIPFYRYRYLWLVKAEHPELGAGACLKATRQLMDGNKMRSFRLDCSYWKPITFLLLLVCVMSVGICIACAKIGPTALIVFSVVASVLAYLLFIPACVVVGQYINVGQGLFYQELTETQTQYEERKHYT